MATIEVPVRLGPALGSNACTHWEQSSARLLKAVPPEYTAIVQRLLQSPHLGGAGLREWVSAIALRGAICPDSIPAEVIQAYLSDPEAVPLYDCEACGIAVPVRPSQRHGREADPELVYFEKCPWCGGKTGWYLYWSCQAQRGEWVTVAR